jgi:acetylornithine deacetylase
MTVMDGIELQDRVLEEVRRHGEDAIALLEALVGVASVNPDFPGVDRAAAIGGERRCSELLAERFAELGCRLEWVAPDPDRPNLVAVLAGTGSGRSLVLNGHVDTVPPVRAHTWSQADPWRAERRDGAVFGLGSTDMKGGLSAAWLALRALQAAGISLRGDVLVQCVVGEEQMQHQLGTTACLEAGFGADAAIVLEPSATIATVSPGNLVFRVDVDGIATHAGNRGLGLGVNAVEKGLLIVRALQALEARWAAEKRHPQFPDGFFALLPGAFHADAGAPSPAYSADRAEIGYLGWYPPDDDPETVKAEIEASVAEAAAADDWLAEHPPRIEWQGNWPAAQTAADAPHVRSLRAAYERATGRTPESPAGFMAVSDASFLEAAGIPTAVYGPGELALAHAADEHVAEADITNVAATLALAAMDWCGVAAYEEDTI